MSDQRTILVVDDEQKNLLIMESLLMPLRHRVVCVTSGLQALAVVKKEPPDLILLDVMMPEMDGCSLCKLLKSNEQTRLIPIIMVTTLDETSERVRAFESDADDFLPKPVNRHELLARVRSCLRIKGLNDRLESSESVIFAFAQAVEAKDPYTIGHSERVSKYALDLGMMAGLPAEKLTELKRGGLLHDIGKIGVPDAVLQKPGKLNPEEFEIMQQHTIIGEKICRSLKSFGTVLPLIRSHHERLDGSGYPDGLKAGEISVAVRVLAIADTVDAMTSDRAYRTRLSRERVIQILEEEANGGRLDGDLIQLCIQRLPLWMEELESSRNARAAAAGILDAVAR